VKGEKPRLLPIANNYERAHGLCISFRPRRSLSCRGQPRPALARSAVPILARPSPAWPRQAKSCQSSTARPRQAMPCHSKPNLPLPRRPRLARPSLNQARTCPALPAPPILASPGRAPPRRVSQCLTSTRHASPCQRLPRHALPILCSTCPAVAATAMTGLVRTCLASITPRHVSPAMPSLARPRRYMASRILTGLALPILPRLALPHQASPSLTKPRQAAPNLARPRRPGRATSGRA